MANIHLTLPVDEVAVTGKQVTFEAPCNSSEVDGIVIDGIAFSIVDALGNPITSNSFVKGSLVSVILHLDTLKAFIQNPATYIEAVQYTPMGLTENEKSVARNNIDSAKSLISSKEGTIFSINDSSDNSFLKGLHVFGRTYQGTSSDLYANPIRLTSIGNSTGKVQVQIDDYLVSMDTPTGLPGIPVEADGNYVDDEGTHWVCDEIDFARGVYINRIGRVCFYSSTPVSGVNYDTCYTISLESIGAPPADNLKNCLCTRFNGSPSDAYNNAIFGGGGESNTISVAGSTVYISPSSQLNSIDSLQFAFGLWNSKGEPAELLYILKEPVEIPLPDSLIEYFRGVLIKKPTFVSSQAWVCVDYVADIKDYIDMKCGETPDEGETIMGGFNLVDKANGNVYYVFIEDGKLSMKLK